MFKDLKKFVEEQIGRKLTTEETIDLNFKCELISILEADYDNDLMHITTLCWNFIDYEVWKNEQICYEQIDIESLKKK